MQHIGKTMKVVLLCSFLCASSPAGLPGVAAQGAVVASLRDPRIDSLLDEGTEEEELVSSTESVSQSDWSLVGDGDCFDGSNRLYDNALYLGVSSFETCTTHCLLGREYLVGLNYWQGGARCTCFYDATFFTDHSTSASYYTLCTSAARCGRGGSDCEGRYNCISMPHGTCVDWEFTEPNANCGQGPVDHSSPPSPHDIGSCYRYDDPTPDGFRLPLTGYCQDSDGVQYSGVYRPLAGLGAGGPQDCADVCRRLPEEGFVGFAISPTNCVCRYSEGASFPELERITTSWEGEGWKEQFGYFGYGPVAGSSQTRADVQCFPVEDYVDPFSSSELVK